MSYIVVYQRADGSSGLEECSDLDLAVVAAERLRNVDAVESPRIFKTQEVHFDFRPYYRVEVSDVGAPAEAAPVIAPTPEDLDPWAEVGAASTAEQAPAPVAEAAVVDFSGDDAVAEPDVAETPAAEIATPPLPDAEVEPTADVADIFSTEHLPDPPPDFPSVTELAEDVNDAVPPRRGLFGR